MVEQGVEPLEAVKVAVNSGILDWVSNPQYLLVRTNGLDDMDYVGPEGQTLMRVIDRYDSTVAGGGFSRG